MNKFGRCCTLALAFAVFATSGISAQMGSMDKPSTQSGASAKPLLSPPAMTEATLDGAKITIHYNAPSLRGRVMIGEHDPYGKVWRTGANPATSFVTTGNLKIGTLKIPAGNYTLYTLPSAPGTPWMLILNKQTGQWGTVYKPEMDLGRTPMQAGTMPSSQETMSISFEKTMKHSTELHIKWAKVDEWVKIDAEK